MLAAIDYYAPALAYAAALGAMARQAFSETFGHLYDAEPFASFLEAAYGTGGRMECDLGNPGVHWRVAMEGRRPIGYAKLSALKAPAPQPLPGAMELQQIYVLREWQGRGVADQLMEWALESARHAGAPEIYLTVFDHNTRAKRFYGRYGFAEVGRCTFTLGERVDDDRVWRKALVRA